MSSNRTQRMVSYRHPILLMYFCIVISRQGLPNGYRMATEGMRSEKRTDKACLKSHKQVINLYPRYPLRGIQNTSLRGGWEWKRLWQKSRLSMSSKASVASTEKEQTTTSPPTHRATRFVLQSSATHSKALPPTSNWSSSRNSQSVTQQ